MVEINNSAFRNNLKHYFDLCYDKDEMVVVKRKRKRNVVCLSLDKFNNLSSEKIVLEKPKSEEESNEDSKEDA